MACGFSSRRRSSAGTVSGSVDRRRGDLAAARLASQQRRASSSRHPQLAHIELNIIDILHRTYKETGFSLIDPEEGLRGKADILIVGEAFSETATRHGNLISVKARVELKAIDRKTDKIIAVDRQTALVVDLTENIAGKAAIQEAAAMLAERMLPKLTK